MRPAHPLAQPGRLATLDTLAGTAARNEAEEGREEIYEEKKELELESSEAFGEGGGVQLRAGAQVNSDPAKRKNKRIVQHSRKKKDERKKNMDSSVVQWMSRG